MLTVDDLTISYGKHILLDHASCSFGAGKVTGLVAPNGYGKTTLFRAIACMRAAQVEGAIAVDDVSAHPSRDYLSRVFYAPEAGVLLYPTWTVREHLLATKRLWHSDANVNEVAQRARIDGFLKKRVARLSQGMQQQVVLAIATMVPARYILLDEPMNALDPTNVQLFSDIIRGLANAGQGVVISSHILDNLDRISDSLVFIKDGKLVMRGQRGEGENALGTYDRLYGVHFRTEADAGE